MFLTLLLLGCWVGSGIRLGQESNGVVLVAAFQMVYAMGACQVVAVHAVVAQHTVCTTRWPSPVLSRVSAVFLCASGWQGGAYYAACWLRLAPWHCAARVAGACRGSSPTSNVMPTKCMSAPHVWRTLLCERACKLNLSVPALLSRL